MSNDRMVTMPLKTYRDDLAHERHIGRQIGRENLHQHLAPLLNFLAGITETEMSHKGDKSLIDLSEPMDEYNLRWKLRELLIEVGEYFT
jgi:hypothetical protein